MIHKIPSRWSEQILICNSLVLYVLQFQCIEKYEIVWACIITKSTHNLGIQVITQLEKTCSVNGIVKPKKSNQELSLP